MSSSAVNVDLVMRPWMGTSYCKPKNVTLSPMDSVFFRVKLGNGFTLGSDVACLIQPYA
jgi:hypothetical protein